MAGVGKTAFAVHAGHRLADRFPGGQLFLPLHGHTPGQSPVGPADALASLLLAVGVAPAQVPPGLEERAALWRDRVAGTPLLLVLDDAAGSEQVRPLLPGTGGSLVLVTSRRHLSALDDATAISLDTLPPGEAGALLIRLAGRPGLRPADPGVREISRLCGFLPLAVGMVARQLRHHPAWSAAGRAAELAAARDRLGLLETENLSVAAAFDLSYTTLTPGQQRLFRRLGLHPGADIDGYAAAALDGITLPAGRRGLEELYDQYLLTEPAAGRYRLHDLIREHAHTLAGRTDPEEERDAAVGRLLDYYQYTADAADGRVARLGRSRPPAPGARPGAVPVLADRDQALAWTRGERANLLACLDYAARSGQGGRVVALTAGMSAFLQQDGLWADAVARHQAAVETAWQLGDQLSRARALNHLGEALTRGDDFLAAVRAHEEALGICRELGDQLGQANALICLGLVFEHLCDYPAAGRACQEALRLLDGLGEGTSQVSVLVCLTRLGSLGSLTGDYRSAERFLAQALDVCRDVGDRVDQARIAVQLGSVRRLAGDYPAALRHLEMALEVMRDVGHRWGQANVLADLGDVRRRTGDFPAAVRDLEEALSIYGELGQRLGRAYALYCLGIVRRLTGDYPAATRALEEALGICRGIGDLGGEVEALNERGTLHRLSGELALARGCHERSLELSREIGSPRDEASALAGLGRCALAGGDAAQAVALLRQARDIFQRMGAAEASQVRAEVEALASPRAAQ
jgi:tetratricopeptide (TPR) repeat protein